MNYSNELIHRRWLIFYSVIYLAFTECYLIVKICYCCSIFRWILYWKA